MRTCSKTHKVTVDLDGADLKVHIDSDCEHVREYAEKLTTITIEDVTDRNGSKVFDPEIAKSLSLPCLVPNAVINAAWMELGMLSKNLAARSHSNDIVFPE